MVRKRIPIFMTLALVLTLFAACGGSSGAYKTESAAPEAAPQMEMSMEMATDMAAGNSLRGENGSASTSLPENRKWIITMDMTAETENMDAMLISLDEKIAAMGGYVEGQNIYNGSNYADRRWRNANLTVRIPAEQVDLFVTEVEGISNVVRSNKNLEDVTLQYVDTESRKAALETEQARLLELLAQAENMSDLLEIEARLTEVRYQLENAASTLRGYDNRIDFATIYLYIEEVQEYTPAAERTVWQRISEGFSSSVKGVGEGFVNFMVWVLANSPYLVVYGILGVGIFLILRKLRKAGKAKKSRKQLPPEEKAE